MELKYSQIAQLSNFSNDRMVNFIKTKLSESENAAVALVFDDKLIVLDEEKDQFYSVDYKVKDKALKLSGWEPINLIPDDNTRLEEVASTYFDPTSEDKVTVRDLVEAFRLKYADEPVKRLLNQTVIEKKGIVESNSKIKALSKVRQARAFFEDDIKELVEDEKIQTLMHMLSENSPVQNSITRIDFKKPISVAIFEEKSDRVINLSEKKKCKTRSMNVKKKVQNMWTSESFKSELKEMIVEMANAEEPKAVLEKFVGRYKELLVLEEAELADLILKTALMIDEAAKADSLVELFSEYCSLDEAQELKEEFISRNNLLEAGDEEVAEMPAEEEPAEEEGEEEEEKKETSIDEDSINKIVKVLNKIRENLEDKSMEAKYVDAFVEALEDAKVGSVGEGKLKEILDFLLSIHEKAKEAKEEK